MREYFRDAMLLLGVTFAGIQAFYIWRSSDPAAAPPPALLHHPIGGLVMVAVLFIIAGLLNAAPLLQRLLQRLIRLIRRRGTEDQPKPDPTSLPEKTWGEIMAEEDAKRTSERIVIVSVEPQPHYGETEPYIDFRITLINATVFCIESSKIEGQTYYGRTPLMQPPKLFDVKLTNNHSSLYHGEKTTLVVQQPLSSPTIDNLVGARGIVKLDFNRVAITFTVRDGMPGAPESFKWPIGDLIVANRD